MDGLCFFFVFFFLLHFNLGCFTPGNNDGNTRKCTESCYCPGLSCAMIQTMIQHIDQTNKDLAGRNMKKNLMHHGLAPGMRALGGRILEKDGDSISSEADGKVQRRPGNDGAGTR